MTEEETELMQRFGISMARKSVYTYKSYRYERLADAVNYAKAEMSSRQASDHTSDTSDT